MKRSQAWRLRRHALLERVPFERVGRGLELAAHGAPSLDERALYGRANCRRSLGDVSGADADFRAYLARYPNGRFAALARARSR